MAQTVNLWGATYSDVPSIDVPSGNSTARFTDASVTTAIEADVAQGKIFIKADGSQGVGTATGGSGGGGSVTQDQDGFIVLPPTGGGSPSVSGLEYETGTWTPSEDTDIAEISFAKAHSTPPAFVSLYDITGVGSGTWQSHTLYGWTYVNSEDLFGYPFARGNADAGYGIVSYVRRTTSSSVSTTGVVLNTSSSDSTDSAIQNSRYNVTEIGFKAYGNNTSTMWRSAGTYKWIAVWAPTT